MLDALVIGAGPAGSTAAAELARAGWRVALAERAVFPRRKVCGEFISAPTWEVLEEWGIAGRLAASAGPAVTHVGLFRGDTMLAVAMPRPGGGPAQHGRAIGREHLDTMLAERAAHHGAELLQPWSVQAVERRAGVFVCTLRARDAGVAREVESRVVIAAHGSWEPGDLPSQPRHLSARPADLLGFKAHFSGARLPAGLMPLVAFPGGYGGLVESDAGRTSFSCCIRRDALERARRRAVGARAGDALLAHVLETCRGVREAVGDARLDGACLSAGPIRPGIRAFRREGIFLAGNAAGEAHPIVAEGISMAIQSGVLLAERLAARGRNAEEAVQQAVARDYEKAWRRNFQLRLESAALFAGIFLNPFTAPVAERTLALLPSILTLGARASGKARLLERAA